MFEIKFEFHVNSIKTHGRTLYQDESLLKELQLLQEALPADYLQDKVNTVISYVSFLKSRLQ